MLVCPICRQENPEGFRFCGACAAPLTGAQHPREERKIVTVLFCDLVGSTARGEQLDPEDLQAWLSRYHSQVRCELERFGGTVEKFIGDAVVALFGAPAAHEDDPERAVRAALAVRDWARQQPDLQVRIAVNTGEALVVVGARVEQGEPAASGDVLSTAARLQAAAPIDGILVGEQTVRATARVIEYRGHKPVVAKGKSEPVRVWEVVRARSHLGVDVEQAPLSALVGRERELRLLREAFARASEEREPQLVTLVGEPGIGKSRVVYELARIVDASPELVTWRQGRCLSYGERVTFWALGEIVKAQAGILESDAIEAVERKLARSVAALVSDTDAGWLERWLRPLVGGGEERTHGARGEAFPAWRRFIEAVAEQGPAVLVFEDLHWADEGLLDFLDDLAEWTSGVPLLLVCTARPELLAKRPSWGAGRTNALTLSLPPLSAAETAQLVHDLLKRAVLPAEVQSTVVERAGGNPLYAEEFARLLGEGTAAVAMPETVQGIIAARLDALAPEHKRLLQDAAVVGKVFWSGAVAAVGGTASDALELGLRELGRRELIRRERGASVEGEVEYVFRHALIRDVAYSQMPRAERGERHRRAAEWIASLGRTDDHAELLAQHYLQALEYARASGTGIAAFKTPALAALSEAGERALGLSAYDSAVMYFEAALELTSPDDGYHPQLLFLYGTARFWADGSGEDALERAVEALRSRDGETAARAALLLSQRAIWRGEREAAFKWVAQVGELTADHPNSIVQVEALALRSSMHMLAGEADHAILLAREALERLDGLDRPDLCARAFDIIGTCRVALGDERGMDDQRRAIEIARKGHASQQLLTALNNLDSSRRRLGLLRELQQGLEERRRTMQDVGGSAHTRDWLLYSQVFADYLAGRWSEAVGGIERFLEGIAEGGTHYLESELRLIRALISLARDQLADARADAERGLDAMTPDPQVLAPTLCAHAYVSMSDGRVDAANADFDQLLAIAGAAGGLGSELPGFAWLAVDLARVSDGLTVVTDARAPRWRAVGQAILMGDAATAADLLEAIGDRPNEAYARLRAGGKHLHRALNFYESVGATRYVREAESLLSASA